jgi:type II secretory pathway pseudopilin PulG
MQNKAGFTLVEILLIILLVSMLGVAALTGFMNTSDSFNFLDNQKRVMSVLRLGRSYAITNKDSETVPRYGLEIKENSIKLFKDDEVTPFEFSGDTVINSVNLPADYSITSLNENIKLPIYLYYETGSGNLKAFATSQAADSIVLLAKSEFRHIPLQFAFEDEMKRYIYIIQVSGMIEESVISLH